MNSNFKTKLLLKLANKKANQGFTLVELLVVTIIVGVLAAIALPNLLGQVGKAREVEAKNGLGAINRAQQGYHLERQTFLNSANVLTNNPLGVVLTNQFFNFSNTGASNTTANINANSLNNALGARSYSAAIAFNTTSGVYGSGICQTNTPDTTAPGFPSISNTTATCSAGELVK